ncbi:MAG: type II toxin-antitoxin system VapC family toxin [Victivallales bacterium]|nr:type II toxin-antitoxin system VapC family toxin [Victivallales bacterium]
MLFDTDVLIWMFRGMKKAAQLVNATPKRQLSIINYMEILQGAKNKFEQVSYKHFFSHYHFDILPVTEAISHRASILIEEHSLSGGLHVTDALIAATACEHRLTLCTANQKHIKSIAGLDFKVFDPGDSSSAE